MGRFRARRISLPFAGFAPLLLIGGLAAMVAFAATGIWLLTWAVDSISGAIARPPPKAPSAARESAEQSALPAAQLAALPPSSAVDALLPPPFAQPPAPPAAREQPPPRLEDPAPIAEVDVPSLPPAERCEDIFVYIVSTSARFPESSAASIASGAQAPGRFRRVGQSIGDWEVSAIVDDWSGLNPQVWLSRENQVCRAELSGNPARAKLSPRPKKKKSRKKKSRRSR